MRPLALALLLVSAAAADKDRAALLTRQARGELAVGKLEQAEQLARQAAELGIADRAFAPDDDTPTARGAFRGTTGRGRGYVLHQRRQISTALFGFIGRTVPEHTGSVGTTPEVTLQTGTDRRRSGK